VGFCELTLERYDDALLSCPEEDLWIVNVVLLDFSRSTYVMDHSFPEAKKYKFNVPSSVALATAVLCGFPYNCMSQI